ncbi:MAG TPA: hypothetical protein VHC22_11575 [Pirellulales bacterium]|nr:hypothetical protein [Pirellulales bacterium]
MKFALLACDPDTLELAREVSRAPDHTLVWACQLGEWEQAVRAAAPGLVVAEHWEHLLGGTVADVVIVSRADDEEQRAEQLRKLAQAGAAMIVSHPVVDSMLVCYELDMIRQESRAGMVPYVPARWHPVWLRLSRLVAEGATGPLGVIEQVVVERISPERGRREVLREFVRDIELALPFCGRLNNASAMTAAGVRSAADAINYGTLSVQMASLSKVLVRWSVATAEPARGRFTLIGTRGSATLVVPHMGAWRLDVNSEGRTASEDFEEAPLAAIALPSLLRGLQLVGATAGNPEVDSPATVPDWLDACHTMELADAVQHSLERGRAIELHYEAPSEHATFKGLMSGIGCLLLIVGLLVLVVATTAVNAGVPLADYWPQILLGVLVVFLLLQLLRLVFPSQSS